MALIAVAADKGAPGVTTACVALSAVWPRPVLLAECDPAGGDVAARLPGARGGRLDPGRGMLSLAAAARRGLEPGQVWGHTQRLHGGLDVLAGVVTAEQGAGLDLLWGPLGEAFASLPQGDVIADCGRIGADGPRFDLLAGAAAVLLLTRPTLAETVRLRERVATVAAGLAGRGRPESGVGVVVVAAPRRFHSDVAEVAEALAAGPAEVIGGLAHEPRAAELLGGEWSGRLGRSLLMRTARDLAQRLAGRLGGAPGAEAAVIRPTAIVAPPTRSG